MGKPEIPTWESRDERADEAYDIARQREVDAEQLSAEEYFADNDGPSLSSGIANLLVSKSPLHAWYAHPRLNPDYRREERAEFDYGTAAHALLLEGDESRIAVIEADDWRTKAAKEARAQAYADRKTPMLPRQLATVRAMVAAARTAIAESEIAAQWARGLSEQSIAWTDPAGNTRCKALLDRISNDRAWVFDYKTCSNAEPDAFARSALSMGYDVQEAFYRRGVKAKYGKEPRFVFVAQEKDAPYACSLVAFDPALQEMADRKVQYALAIWAGCLASGKWRGYPSRVCYTVPPAWYAANAEALNEMIEIGGQA